MYTIANSYENGNVKDIYENNDDLNYHDIKRKLQQNRMTCPAFDTARYVLSVIYLLDTTQYVVTHY